MASPCLILFVDGLPHYELARTANLVRFPATNVLRPTFGYSPNIYAELYAGKTADEIGFFNEWGRDPDGLDDPVRRTLARLAPILDKTRATGLTSTLAHRVVRRLTRTQVANIPFALLPWFSHQSVKVYDRERFPHPTIFDRYGFHLVTGEQFRGIGRRDERVFAEGLAALQHHDRVYLSFVDYDNLCHRHGVASSICRDRLALVDAWVEVLNDTFLSRHPGAPVVVLSDHGMLDVREGFDLRIEQAFGPARPDRYLYFPDSVMCRVWSSDAGRLAAVAQWLDELQVGVRISEEERAEWGVTRREFGDILFVLHPGLCFQQNFHGWRLPRAMHGYHPSHYSQAGIFLVRNGRDVPNATTIGSLDAHSILEAQLAE